MRALLVLGLIGIVVGCDGGRAVQPGTQGPRPQTDGATAGADGAGAGDADGASGVDAGVVADAGEIVADAGLTADAGAPADAGHAADARVAPPDAGMVGLDAASPPDSGPPAADVQITTSCGADFGGDPVVSHNGSIAVGSLRGSSLTASLQFDFRGQSGVIALGTRHRIDTGLVVNLVTQSTWTNLSQDTQVIIGMAPDTIGGTLNLRSYDGPRGIMDVELTGVRLQNPSDLSFCTVSGRIRAQRLGR